MVSAAAKSMSDIMLEGFGTRADHYSVEISPQCPKSTVVTASWTESGYRSKGALKFDYRFGDADVDPYTLGSAFALWSHAAEYDISQVVGLSFYARGMPGTGIVVRLVDATGQTHHRIYEVAGAGWERVEWIFNSPNAPGALGAHWGGASDGVVHQPLKQIQIGPSGICNRCGTLLIDSLILMRGPEATDEVVKVDLSAEIRPAEHRASGFLHSISTDEPKDPMVVPIKPKLFRLRMAPWDTDGKTGFASIGRLQGFGARIQIVVSDEYQWSRMVWDKTVKWPGDDGDWRTLDQVLTDLVQRTKAGGFTVDWDIWNEPDQPIFWKRSREQYLETWVHAYRKLRELDPKATIVGPSVGVFTGELMEQFLLYAKAHNALPDVLSWHEMSPYTYGYKSIPQHVSYLRAFMKRHGIKIQRISLNEIVGPHLCSNPGVHAWFFAAIEDAGVESACHACWDEPGRPNSGYAQTLDGLLTYPERQPRSVWWIYKEYADVTGTLMSVTPGSTVNGVVGKDDESNTVRAVFGRDAGGKEPITISFINLDEFPVLAASGKVRVTADHIPDTGYSPLRTPDRTIDAEYPICNGKVNVQLPKFGPSDAYVVRLSPGY
jgi:hypothetical protein